MLGTDGAGVEGNGMLAGVLDDLMRDSKIDEQANPCGVFGQAHRKSSGANHCHNLQFISALAMTRQQRLAALSHSKPCGDLSDDVPAPNGRWTMERWWPRRPDAQIALFGASRYHIMHNN